MAQHPAIIPENEDQRISAVRRYDILDTPPDGMFDRITAMAARRFGAPISIISIVDTDRIWFKSHHGVAVDQIGRDPGLCASAILEAHPYIIEDARKDVRSLANPLVAGDFGLRFYAGVPLQTSDGFNLGTLCVIDREPRPLDQSQIDDLKDLASVVMDQLELRLAARRAVSRAEMMTREIEHRVMNSLQFISGMLAMQSRSADLAETAGQLEVAANRVAAIGRVHRHFSTHDASETISCVGYLDRLCGELSQILVTPIEVSGDDEEIATALIQPIGLLVNELVTNAAKHGAGPIHVSYRIEAGQQKLSVCDQGEGLPADFDADKARGGLGMRVIVSLTRQLRGSLSATSNPDGRGACFTVTFPA